MPANIRAAKIESLQVDESYVEGKRVPLRLAAGEKRTAIADRMRNAVGPAVNRITHATGAQFYIETAYALLPRHVLILVAITRWQ